MKKKYKIGDKYFIATSSRDAAEQWGKENAAHFEHGGGTVVLVERNKKIVRMLVSCVVSKVFIARSEK